jgi:hypothetical protein
MGLSLAWFLHRRGCQVPIRMLTGRAHFDRIDSLPKWCPSECRLFASCARGVLSEFIEVQQSIVRLGA